MNTRIMLPGEGGAREQRRSAGPPSPQGIEPGPFPDAGVTDLESSRVLSHPTRWEPPPRRFARLSHLLCPCRALASMLLSNQRLFVHP
jgi:hypothetical protein